MGKCAHLLASADERTNQFSADVPGCSADEEHGNVPSGPSPGRSSLRIRLSGAGEPGTRSPAGIVREEIAVMPTSPRRELERSAEVRGRQARKHALAGMVTFCPIALRLGHWERRRQCLRRGGRLAIAGCAAGCRGGGVYRGPAGPTRHACSPSPVAVGQGRWRPLTRPANIRPPSKHGARSSSPRSEGCLRVGAPIAGWRRTRGARPRRRVGRAG